MPEAFERCRKNGGKIRTKKLSGGRYMPICYDANGAHAGEVHTKKEAEFDHNDEHIKNLTEYKDIKEFAKALLDGKVQYREKDIYKIKPVFRLHPPRKGHRGTIKKHYGEGGTLGNVGEYINVIIHKML